MPDFMTISQTLLRYGDTSIFQDGGRRRLGFLQEGQHPLTGQRAANFRLLANQ